MVEKGRGTHLPLRAPQNRRQPPTLPTIHQKEHCVVFVHELFELYDVGFALGDGRGGGGDGVSGHGDGEGVACCVLGYSCLPLASINTEHGTREPSVNQSRSVDRVLQMFGKAKAKGERNNSPPPGKSSSTSPPHTPPWASRHPHSLRIRTAAGGPGSRRRRGRSRRG